MNNSQLVSSRSEKQPLFSISQMVVVTKFKSQLPQKNHQPKKTNRKKIPEFALQVIKDQSHPYRERRTIQDRILDYTIRLQVIEPENKYLLFWHCLVMLIILYFIFEIGFLMAFGQQFWQDQLYYMHIPKIIFIAMLLIDIFLSFVKGYYNNGLLITSHRFIVRKYIRLQLWIDTLGLVSLLIPQITQQIYLNYIKILFFLKFYSIHRIDTQFFRATLLNMYTHSVYLLVRLNILMFIGTHYLGLFFYMVDYWVLENNYYGPNTPQVSYLYNANAFSNMIFLLPWYGRYEYTFYFSLGSMNTIAYGDITPLNPLQTLYITGALFFYAVCFGYVLSQLLRVIFEAKSLNFEHDYSLNLINNVLKQRFITLQTRQKVVETFETLMKQEKYRDRVIQKQLIQSLPLKVKLQLYMTLYGKLIYGLGLFGYDIKKQFQVTLKSHHQTLNQSIIKGLSISNFKWFLLQNIVEIRFLENEYFYLQNQQYDSERQFSHAAFFSNKPVELGLGGKRFQSQFDGFSYEVSSYRPQNNNGKSFAKVEGLFGQCEFFTQKKRKHYAKAIQGTLVLILPHKRLLEGLKLANSQQYQLYYYLKQTVQKQICYFCDMKVGHQTKQCPFLKYKPLAYTIEKKNHSKVFNQKEGGSTLLLNSKILKSNKPKYSSLKLFKQNKKIQYKINKKVKQKLIKRHIYYAKVLNDSGSQSESQTNSEDSIDYQLENYIDQTEYLINNLRIINQRKQDDRTVKEQSDFLQGVDQLKVYKNYFPQSNISKIVEELSLGKKHINSRRKAELML